jgi:hypothetical protein
LPITSETFSIELPYSYASQPFSDTTGELEIKNVKPGSK